MTQRTSKEFQEYLSKHFDVSRYDRCSKLDFNEWYAVLLARYITRGSDDDTHFTTENLLADPLEIVSRAKLILKLVPNIFCWLYRGAAGVNLS